MKNIGKRVEEGGGIGNSGKKRQKGRRKGKWESERGNRK
jgi:hypothetical protein